jgi:bacterioferritin-associated ferredoxin
MNIIIMNGAAPGRAPRAPMIVCLCHAVSDRTLRRLAASGASDEEVARATGAGTSCGCCAPAVAQVLAEARAACSSPEPCPGCPRRAPAAAGLRAA